MATKQIYAAPEQYDLPTFLKKFPNGQDTIITALTVLAFEDSARDLWNNNWSIRTPNPNNWSIDATFEAYRAVLGAFSGNSAKPFLIQKDVTYGLNKYWRNNIKMITDPGTGGATSGIFYSKDGTFSDQIELTTPQLRYPNFGWNQLIGYSPNARKLYVCKTHDGTLTRWDYPPQQTSQVWGCQQGPANIDDVLETLWVLYHILPPEIRTNIQTTIGISPSYNATINLETSETGKILRNIGPLVMSEAMYKYLYFHINSESKYMDFSEKYIAKENLVNGSLPDNAAPNTIYYCITKDAPLTGLKNPDGSNMVVKNPELQYTADFWSKIFSDKGLLPVLQGVATLYPTSINIQYDTKSQAAYNSLSGKITFKESLMSTTKITEYHIKTFISQFDVTIDSQRRILVKYNRDILTEDIHLVEQWGSAFATFLIILAIALAVAGGISLLAGAGAPEGGLVAGGVVGDGAGVIPASVAGGGSTIGDFIASIGSGLTSILGPIAAAIPVITPFLGLLGIKPKPKGGSVMAPINNTCQTGYTLTNGQCVQDSTSPNFAGIFTPTNLMLMAGGGIVLGLLFMGDGDNKAYRAAKKAKSEHIEDEKPKTNRPKKKYNKRR